MAIVSKPLPFRKRAIVGAAAFVGVGLVLSAQAFAANKQDDIQELMRVLRMAQAGDLVLAMIVQGVGNELGERHPDIPADVLEGSEMAVFQSLRWKSSELLDQVGNVYDEQFTEAEIEELLAFYRTPTGQKLIEVMPEIIGLTQEKSMEWSETLAPEIRDRLRSRLSNQGYALGNQE